MAGPDTYLAVAATSGSSNITLVPWVPAELLQQQVPPGPAAHSYSILPHDSPTPWHIPLSRHATPYCGMRTPMPLQDVPLARSLASALWFSVHNAAQPLKLRSLREPYVARATEHGPVFW